MRTLLLRADALVNRLGRPSLDARAPLSVRSLVALAFCAAPLYGVAMGSYSLTSPGRPLMMLYAGVKAPLLLGTTTLICLPAFFVLNTVLGLRSDFGRAVRAILAGQAALGVALASLAPITRLLYTSGVSYREALLVNAMMFTVATGVGQVITLRRYRSLIERSGRHRAMLWMWVALYAFVGIEAGWMLRPFIGAPDAAVTFFRQEPFSNAYIAISHMILGR